jgi:cephalosporin-C deacetylase-like acetyl esterase
VWERDSPGSPPVEDRFRLVLAYAAGKPVSIEINPWGALRVEQNGQPVTANVLAAAAVQASGWDVEIAVPLATLGSPTAIRLERIRSRRPLAPEFRWTWPADGQAKLEIPTGTLGARAEPEFAPPLLGNREAPAEVGRVLTVPPLGAEWDDPAWSGVPSFQLPRNEPRPRAPRYPTEVRWVQDGRTLAIIARATEPDPVVARAGGRNSAVAADDHLAIHLATSGSAFLEFAVNSVGAVNDPLATGPHMERPQTSWNAAGFQVQTNIRSGAWTARINIPLAECAAALGETGVPRNWRIVISRYRAARPGEAAEISALPAIHSTYFYGPVRYRRMILADAPPARVAVIETGLDALPRDGLAAELAHLDPNVWSPVERRYHSVRTMLSANQHKRVGEAVFQERQEWARIRTKEDWERYRDVRMKALRSSLGVFPPERNPLDVQITATRQGQGYKLENLVYQTRPGFYAAANLYLPAQSGGPAPVIVIQHSQHYPRTQAELHDMGVLWARKGAAVLLLERLGFGERAETTPFYRQGYASRFTFKKQLNLLGESHMAWMAWDIIRAVDLLCERSDIDRSRLILIGAVAGGGEPAALATALDPRIAAVASFNYDQGHVRLDADYEGEIPKQISPWFITASLAPRKYIRAFEFGWEGAEEPDYPELWVSGWERSQKVWDFYGARDSLAATQAFGLIRLSMERIQHCMNVGPAQRKEMHPLFEKWFQIPSAAEEDAAILPDSELTYNSVREASRAQEAGRLRPHSELMCIPPQVAARLARKPLHEIAREMAARDLEAARRRRNGTGRLSEDLRAVLGTTDPNVSPHVEQTWQRMVAGVSVEAMALHVEDGIEVPLLFLKSANGPAKLPVVVAVAQGGKSGFLSYRGPEIAHLLAAGTAVCLPDVRGTGETAADPEPGDRPAQLERALGGSLMGARLKDLRAVLAYLRSRQDVDAGRIAVWGESFARANSSRLVMDEMEYEAGPEMEYQAEPAGAVLAMLAALYDGGVHAVAAAGGLAEFLSVLRSAFTYVSMDALIPGILKAADIPDIAAGLAPRPLLISDCVDGRNVPVGQEELNSAFSGLKKTYSGAGQSQRLKLSASLPASAIADWLLSSLK